VPGPRVSTQTHRCPKFGPRMGVSSPPDTFGSARWALFFWPLCLVGQKRTRGVRLGRPAEDVLTLGRPQPVRTFADFKVRTQPLL
jgi:hypothetical protein